jgi:hypothetical protein
MYWPPSGLSCHSGDRCLVDHDCYDDFNLISLHVINFINATFSVLIFILLSPKSEEKQVSTWIYDVEVMYYFGATAAQLSSS